MNEAASYPLNCRNHTLPELNYASTFVHEEKINNLLKSVIK